jgi:O-antigen ligase
MAGLASRMGFIALTVIMLLSLILLLKVPNYVKLSIVLSIVFIQLFLIFNFPTLKEKFIGLFNYNLDENSYKHRADVRLTIWQSCLEIIKENPLLGVGLGDVEQKLLDKYKRFNYTEGLDRRYNAHNQFLQTTVEVGVLGLATLLFVMGVSISFAITKKNFVSLCFLSIALLFFLSESILVRQKGIVFFSFFMPLLNVVAFKDKGIEKS